MSEQTLRNITICNSDFTQYTQSSPYLTPLQPPQTPVNFIFIALLRRFIEVKVTSHFTSPISPLRSLVRPTFLKYWQQVKTPLPRISLKAAHQVLHTRAIKSKKLNTKRVHFLQAHP